MEEATARPSTDLESSPLLVRANDGTDVTPARRSFWKTLTDLQRELTLLEKLMAFLILLLFLLATIFIGLFTGSQHRLHGIENKPPTTITHTRHATSFATYTATTTQVSTTTVHNGPVPPGPTPTEVPLPPTTICMTPDCILLSASILEALDTSVDPCEDPYQAFTGGWREKNVLPKSKGRFGSFNEVQQNNQKILLDVLTRVPKIEAGPESDAEKSNLLKLQTVFNDCMDEDYLDTLSFYPLLPLVEDIKTLFPLDEVHEDKKGHQKKMEKRKIHLTKVLGYLHSRGIDSLFGFVNEGDIGVDPQMQILWFYQDGLGLPSKEYYDEETYTNLYTEVVASIINTVYNGTSTASQLWPTLPNPFPFPGITPEPSEDDTDASKPHPSTSIAERILALEKKLAKAQAELEDLTDPSKSYNPVEFEALEKQVGWFNLREYVASFAPRSFPEKVVVTSEAYVKDLAKIVEEEDDWVLQGYFLVRAAMTYASYLGPNVQVRLDAEKQRNALSGVKQGARPERDEVCLNHVSAAVGHLAGAEFIKKAFKGDSKTKAENVIISIIDAFKNKLVRLPWMDKESAKLAVKKANAITPKIGYPLYPNATSPVALQQYYSRLTLDKGDFLGNFIKVKSAEEIREWQVVLGRLRNKDAWMMNADTVNAYESPADNEIVFPAGILQPPFFSAEWPSYLHYGAFGAVAAHELCHAFDNSGSQYDYEGRYRQWWTNSTVDAFKERAQCIAKQYSDFYVQDAEGHKVYVKGNNTNGEAIGDSGLRIAFDAWKSSIKKGEKEVELPGLAAYTVEQLFFIAFGRIWAQNIAPASLVAQVRSDPHAPNQFRVSGTLRNFEKFAEVFQCKKGSKMNPTERCELW